MKLRVGDKVLVTTGKDKGKKGSIRLVLPTKDSVMIEGVNQIVKHRKPMMGKAGERVTIEKPILASKVVILNQAGEPDRIGFKVLKDGSKVRIFRKTGGMVDSIKDKKQLAKTTGPEKIKK